MSTTLVSPPVVKPKSLSCPNCGGPVELRGFAHTLSVVCPQCLTVLDASTPEFAILQKFTGKLRMQPLVPLGTRGTINGTVFEVIGFQYREVKGEDEDDTFGWSEYLLFNPYKGFRYLSEYHGHWNFIRVLSSLPEVLSGSRKRLRYQGQTYAPFDSAKAQTAFVLGEFPWQVRVGEQVHVEDFVFGRLMLSSETTDGEVTWSQGEYWKSQQVWQAFRLPGTPPQAVGTFANQPSPFAGKVRSAWRLWLWLMAALVALAIVIAAISPNREVFRQSYSFTPGTPGESAAFVTPEFELTGRTSNLEVATRTNLSNNWAYFSFALINVATGAARDFGREISNSSSEGSPNDRVVIPTVPPGKYYLRVEPEMQAGQSTSGVRYEIIVRGGVPTYGWLWIAALLLTIPPIVTSVRAASFESARWRESDYAPGGSS
jgi:Domain of unknown function (DUF4178)